MIVLLKPHNFKFVPFYEVFTHLYGLPINFSQLLIKSGKLCIWKESHAFACPNAGDVACFISSKPQMMNNPQTLLDYVPHQWNVLYVGVRVTLAKKKKKKSLRNFPVVF